MSWTWQGRQLTKAVKDKTVTFTYDSEGIRTSKNDGTNTTKYLLNGTQILAQKTGSTTLSFFYDQQGNRVGMADGKNNFYYYIYNVQGDVIALADASTGKLAVTYTYDAWGKLVELKDNTANSVGTQNPFRYRGYYYDTETSLYYLQTRYYDPEVGRFINADAFTSTDISGALSANMFAYCENRPTIGSDPTGEWVHILIGAAVGAVGSLASQVLSDVIASAATGNFSLSSWQTYAGAVAGGAAGGAVYAATKNSTAAGAASGFVSTFTTGALEKTETNRTWGDIVAESVNEGLIGAKLGKAGDRIGIKGKTKGRNSWAAVYKSGLTKLKNGTAKRMSLKVMKKGLGSTLIGNTYSTLYSAAKRIFSLW